MPERLTIVKGFDTGAEIEIPDDGIAFGRDEDGIGKLGDDPRLSRRHARIVRDADGRLLLEDLGSSNGSDRADAGRGAGTGVRPAAEPAPPRLVRAAAAGSPGAPDRRRGRHGVLGREGHRRHLERRRPAHGDPERGLRPGRRYRGHRARRLRRDQRGGPGRQRRHGHPLP